MEEARAMIEAHRQCGTSKVSAVWLDDAGGWELVGPQEHHEWELADLPGWLPVTGRDQVRGLAEKIRQYRHPDQAAQAEQLRSLVRLAEQAQPMIEVLLAVSAARHAVEWDTPESIAQAARRMCLDWAWDRYEGRRSPLYPRLVDQPRDVFTDILALGWEPRPAHDYAASYLASRNEIDAALGELGIVWDGELLTVTQAAARCGIAPSTWRSHIARSEAPAADYNTQWRTATIDAWRLQRRNTTWWGI